MQLRWHLDGWADYVDWQTNDKKVLRKINSLIEDTLRHQTEGLGKPEPLKEDLSGFWSCRITQEHRLVYAFDEDSVTIFQCKGHYE